jgi:hypothetical protein
MPELGDEEVLPAGGSRACFHLSEGRSKSMTQSTSGRQARLLGGLLVVPEGARRSALDRLRSRRIWLIY